MYVNDVKSATSCSTYLWLECLLIFYSLLYNFLKCQTLTVSNWTPPVVTSSRVSSSALSTDAFWHLVRNFDICEKECVFHFPVQWMMNGNWVKPRRVSHESKFAHFPRTHKLEDIKSYITRNSLWCGVSVLDEGGKMSKVNRGSTWKSSSSSSHRMWFNLGNM